MSRRTRRWLRWLGGARAPGVSERVLWRSRLAGMPSLFTGAVGVGAVLSVAGLEALVTRFHDADAVRRERVVEVERRAVAELAGLGFVPAPGPAAQRLRAAGVEVLQPVHAVSLPGAHGVLTARAASAPDQQPGVELLARELLRYRPGFLARAGLRRVLLCAGLAEGGQPIPSLPNYHGALLVDPAGEGAWLARLVHHEVFHFVDFAADERVGDDAVWAGLNDPWFSYGRGGRWDRDPGGAGLGSGGPGFISGYARSALEEDQAETFAFLATAPGEVARLSAGDARLAAKVLEVRAVVARLARDAAGSPAEDPAGSPPEHPAMSPEASSPAEKPPAWPLEPAGVL